MASNKIKLLVLSFCIGDLTAWERTAAEGCKNEDLASFEEELSPCARAIFTQLSPDKQEMAMDYADKSSMPPDDAVVQVSSECKKIK